MRTNLRGLRYLLWFVYALLTVAATMLLLGKAAGGTAAGLLGTAAVLCAAGVLALLLHRLARRIPRADSKGQPIRSVAEAAAAVVLLAIGVVLRVRQMDGMGQLEAYFEMAEVAPGKTIPQLVHGAVYFYVQLLHGVFYFLGNKFAAGIWLQIVLQLTGALVLYVVLRKLSGHLAALIVLAFLTCSPHAVQSAMLLSPEPLFLLLCALALAVTAMARGGALFPACFFLYGLLIGAVSFLDIGGLLLLLPMAALALERRSPEEKKSRKAAALLLGMAGTAAGVGGCMAGDAWLSGKKMAGVAGAWLKLYRGGGFAVSVSVEEVSHTGEWLVLCGLLALGIFSFWCDRRRDDAGVYTAGLCLALAGSCFGVFTREMPGTVFVYLQLVLLAGVAAESCLSVPPETTDADAKGVEKRSAERKSELAERKPKPEKRSAERQLELAERKPKPGKRSAEQKQKPARQLPEQRPESAELQRESIPGGNYIENPLPLPKRHERRVLDYDIEISDDDDFDI